MYKFVFPLLIGCIGFNCNFTLAQINQIKLKKYNEHLFFSYNSNVKLTMDKETFEPISFRIELPQRLQYREIANSSDFGFYYKFNQVIFVSTDILKKRTKIDTCYIPSEKEIKNLINNYFITNYTPKLNIKEMQLKRNRKHFVIKKGGNIILLFNIKKQKFKYYLSLVKKNNFK